MRQGAGSFVLAVAFLGGLAGQEDEPPRPALGHYNLGKGGVALDGYDPVAYFPEGGGKPKKGDAGITATHAGVVYRFASEQDRSVFVANPARFEPAYGGWCAWAMSDGEGDEVDIDPGSFLIEEGRLLLFYDGLFADTRKKWLKKGGETLHPVADANWRRISGEAAPRELAQFNLEVGLALHGYDPVAYFSETGAIPGTASIATTHDGVTYRFATEAARQAFLLEPGRYEPSYGGWCATAMARGEKVDVAPDAFLVEDGRLRLFASKARRDEWNATPDALRRAADASWAALQGR